MPFTTDPFSGKPFGYSLESDGSVRVWGVWDDGIDDGGKIGPVSSTFSGTFGWTLDQGVVNDGNTTDAIVQLPPPKK